MDLTAQILSTCFTKTAALRDLSDLEDEARKKPAKNQEEIFTKAKAEIAAIEPLHLLLPRELPDGELEKIVGKLRKSYGPNFLVEIKFQGDLIGGCTMSYKGIYKDYSLHNKIVQNREKIREIMNKLLWK